MGDERRELIVLAFSVDQPDDELLGVAAAIVLRGLQVPVSVLATVSGYDDDPRELPEIPEVVAFCRRLVDLGVFTVLDVNAPEGSAAWGSYAVWCCAHGKMRRGGPGESPLVFTATEDEKRAFTQEVLPAGVRRLDRVTGGLG